MEMKKLGKKGGNPFRSIILEYHIEFRHMQIGMFLFPFAGICVFIYFRYCIPWKAKEEWAFQVQAYANRYVSFSFDWHLSYHLFRYCIPWNAKEEWAFQVRHPWSLEQQSETLISLSFWISLFKVQEVLYTIKYMCAGNSWQHIGNNNINYLGFPLLFLRFWII